MTRRPCCLAAALRREAEDIRCRLTERGVAAGDDERRVWLLDRADLLDGAR